MIRTPGLVFAMALATALGGCAMIPGFGPGPGPAAAPAVTAAPVEYVRDVHS